MSYTEINRVYPCREKAYLFVSDVHLGAFSRDQNNDLEQELIRLVDYCERKSLRIIILGDFFDYWMEYPGRWPELGARVLQRFKTFHENTGWKTLFVTGNHDNWTRGYLCGLGFDLEHEYRTLLLPVAEYPGNPPQKVMVLHGDGLREPEWKFPRPIIHRFLRNLYFVKLYQFVFPPVAGLEAMKLFSAASRWKDKRKPEVSRRKQIDEWVMSTLASKKTLHAMVYGHHHHAGIWSREGKTALNCGFFGRDRTLGLYTNGFFEIVIWNGAQNELRRLKVKKSAEDGPGAF